MAVLAVIPNQIILLVCAALDDEDLVNLCQVSQRFNPLALDTYFARNAMSNSDVAVGNISVTSQSIRGLGFALFISSVKALRCVFTSTTAESDITASARFLSRLPQIPQAEIFIRDASSSSRHPAHILPGCLLDLIDGFAQKKSNSLLILGADGCLCVSTCVRRHEEHWKAPIFGSFDDGELVDSHQRVGLDFFMTGRSRLYGWLAPSDSHMRQKDNVRAHLSLRRRSIHSIQFSYPAIPELHFSNQAMIMFNSATLTTLSIGCTVTHCREWYRTLPTISLPALEWLCVQYGAKLKSSDLRTFVHRHPTITTLRLQNLSVQYSDLMPFTVDSLPKLNYLSAPAQHIAMILRSLGNYRQLYGLEIGMPTRTTRLSSGSPADFDELDEIFTVVRNHNVPRFYITVWFPAGGASKDWFMKMHPDHPASQDRVERGVYNLTSISIRTEGRGRFHPDVLSLLPNWLALFPRLEHVSICQNSVGEIEACALLQESIFSKCPQVSHPSIYH
jgi:hypothetical protein